VPNYTASPDFQFRIVASLARDETFFKAYFTCVQPEFFTYDTHQMITRQVLEFAEKYRRVPDMIELEQTITEKLRGTIHNDTLLQETIGLYRVELKNLFDLPRELMMPAQEHAIDFARQAAFKSALREGALHIEDEQGLEKAQKCLQKAAMVGVNLNDFGINYFRNLPERVNLRLSQPPEAMRIPFLIPKLDAFLGGVGYRQNGGIPEMLIFLGPPNRGKSRALCHMAKVGLGIGKNVMIFSAEMSAELYAERLDMSIGAMTTRELYDFANVSKLERRVKWFQGQRGELYIRKYPSRSVTVPQTVSLLHQMRMSLDFRPDLVIYDYIDEFKSVESSGERRHDLSEISSAMRAVADEFGCAVATATQGNRLSLEKEVVDLQDIAEDIGKANIADLIVSLCQTKEESEKEVPEMRWMVCKNRSGSKGQIVRLRDDTMRMCFSQHPEEMLEEHMIGHDPVEVHQDAIEIQAEVLPNV
jgi:replicative DNA helicase